MTGWCHFPHDADIGVRGTGPTREAAFAQAAIALCAAVTDVARIAPRRRIEIDCAATDDRLLLATWLDAVIYEMTMRKMLFVRFDVRIVDKTLNAQAWGEEIDLARHQPATEPKGATLTALLDARQPDGSWLAQCVVDV